MKKGNEIGFLINKYKKKEGEEYVDGITILIEGKLKSVLDLIIEKEGKYSEYLEVIGDVIECGLKEIVLNIKKTSS